MPKKGDLIVYSTIKSFTYATTLARSELTTEWHIAVVASATRQGVAKTVKKVGISAAPFAAPANYSIVPPSVDKTRLVEALMKACREDWQANDFESLDAVKDFVRGFKK